MKDKQSLTKPQNMKSLIPVQQKLLLLLLLLLLSTYSYAQRAYWSPIAGSNGDGVQGRYPVPGYPEIPTPDDDIFTIKKINNSIYVGGDFYTTKAGNTYKTSNSIAKYNTSSTWDNSPSLPKIGTKTDMLGEKIEDRLANFVYDISDYKVSSTTTPTIAACGLIQLDNNSTSKGFRAAAYLDNSVVPATWKYFQFSPDIIGNENGFSAQCIAYYKGNLYLGGSFGVSTVGIPPLIPNGALNTVLLVLKNGKFEPVPNSPIGGAYVLKVFDEKLYIGGNFSFADITNTGILGRNIAAFDGQSFSTVGITTLDESTNLVIQGLPLTVYSLTNHTDREAGKETLAAGTSATNEPNPIENPLTETSCIGGELTYRYVCIERQANVKNPKIGGVWLLRDFLIEGNLIKKWENIGITNGPVLALHNAKANCYNTLIAGGTFTEINGRDAFFVAQWDEGNSSQLNDNTWKYLGNSATSITAPVFGIQSYTPPNSTSELNLLIGGFFNTIDRPDSSLLRSAANSIAKISLGNHSPCREGNNQTSLVNEEKSNNSHISFSENLLTVQFANDLYENKLSKGIFEVFDISGKQLIHEDVTISSSNYSKYLNLVYTGVYYARFIFESGDIINTKFVYIK